MYTKENLLAFFQSNIDINQWTAFLKDLVPTNNLELRTQEPLSPDTTLHEGYYLGRILQSDNKNIGLFYFTIKDSNVKNKIVGLRNLVKQYINPRYGDFYSALVVFANQNDTSWRLSFVCDIEDDKTSFKRFTFLFGDKDNLYNTAIERFLTLQNNVSFATLKEAFSVEALTKQFYKDLFAWYEWAVSDTTVCFPTTDDKDTKETKIIRLITRLMFVWFIKQKDLVPNKIFNTQYLQSILKDFNPNSSTSFTYYNAILQNLFFATLNNQIIDEQGRKRRFATAKSNPDLKNLYRYAEMFSIPEEEILSLFSQVPFLNGGLFECLDKNKTFNGVEKAFYYDGFSRNPNKQTHIPNSLFFGEIDPEDERNNKEGILEIFSRYNFTIEENTPNEQQIALDPELLGKVFENLLGAYNPETKKTARNSTGSFYTPREVVSYMVDECLRTYLGNTPTVQSLFLDNDNFQKDPQKEKEYQTIAQKLSKVKVLDPACGSGAFPMGLLNRMVDILEKIHTEESTYKLKLQIIEKCIYGIDIQNIAIQISKLRFFISLICDCEKDTSKDNYGIEPLPNLETKFIAANSLLSLKKSYSTKKGSVGLGNLFDLQDIATYKDSLRQIQKNYFSAKTPNKKKTLKKEYQDQRQKLITLLEQEGDFASQDAKQLAEWNPFDQNLTAPYFDMQWMFNLEDGFDIVIGNPPYIQLQDNDGELANLYQDCSYKSFTRMGDIYCLFYERAFQLLRPNGLCCYITSNKWLRSGYGESLRGFFANNTNPLRLIDFGGQQIFQSATVDTNILLYQKAPNWHHTITTAVKTSDKDLVLTNLNNYIQMNNNISSFSSSDTWVILSPIEQSIKQKIESKGTPLKDWDIDINYGIKTGCNDAFIISTDKRNEILSNCADEDERRRTADLIRPILRGRDIRRYSYDWADLWLIGTHNGLRKGGKVVLQPIDINDYPAVKQHLDQYWDRIERRDDQGITPYNLRNCAYWEDFSKPKIVYPNMTQTLPFYYDEKNFLTNQKCFIITGKTLSYLTAFFNSKLFRVCFKDNFPRLQSKGRELSKIFFEKIPIMQVDEKIDKEFEVKVIDIQKEYTTEKYTQIDSLIYTLYDLTPEEIAFIENED